MYCYENSSYMLRKRLELFLDLTGKVNNTLEVIRTLGSYPTVDSSGLFYLSLREQCNY